MPPIPQKRFGDISTQDLMYCSDSITQISIYSCEIQDRCQTSGGINVLIYSAYPHNATARGPVFIPRTDPVMLVMTSPGESSSFTQSNSNPASSGELPYVIIPILLPPVVVTKNVFPYSILNEQMCRLDIHPYYYADITIIHSTPQFTPM